MLAERGDRDPSQEEGSIAIATWSLTVLFIGLVFGSAWGQPSPSAADVLEALRGGGYIIVLHHGATHADQADTDPLNLDNVAKQRQLNDKGRADAKAIGDLFKSVGVPIGKSYSSRFNRAVETARLVGGKAPEATLDVSEGGLVVSPNENNRRTQALRTLVGTAPDPGTNTLVVTHKPNILDTFGKDWFEVKEGEATIFKPAGGGKYALIARVQIDQWPTAKK
jgi:broad specificity phosphatase PhoE